MKDTHQTIELQADDLPLKTRIDKALVNQLPPYSRSTIQSWIRNGLVTLNGQPTQAKVQLNKGDQIRVSIPPERPVVWPAQALDLDVVYQDADIIVINKAAGMVVHPGAGNPDNTLLNGVLHLEPKLGLLPRAGIVHRLDKDTSGLMVLGCNEISRQHLINQLAQRSMSRIYLACVVGELISGGTINQPIGRHRHNRLKMAVNPHGKPAVSHYRVMEKFCGYTLVRVTLESGRTHQIRVHMAWKGYPLVGDPQYGGRKKIPAGANSQLIELLRTFPHQALHSEQLCLIHPSSGKPMRWQKLVPTDIATLIDSLRKSSSIKVKI